MTDLLVEVDLLDKIKDSANGDLIIAACELVLSEEEYKDAKDRVKLAEEEYNAAKAKVKRARVGVMRSAEQCI